MCFCRVNILISMMWNNDICPPATQLGKKFKRGAPVEELPDYARSTHFLATLGMQDYQRNLKRGLLNDSTLHLWNDRSASSPPLGPKQL